MTPNLSSFIRANRRIPVVNGSCIGQGGRGARYTLSNGKTFTLTRDECAALPEGLPWWKGLDL